MIVLKARQDEVLAVLQSIAGIVERRNTLPILANVMIRIPASQIQLTTSDLEIQIRTSAVLDGDAGNLVNVAGVSLLSDNPDALVFASWLLGETAQKYFLEKTFEYSLTSDVSPDPTLPKLSDINGPEIDLSDLSSLDQTLQLLTEAGLI